MTFLKILTPLAIFITLISVIILGPTVGGLVLLGVLSAIFMLVRPVFILIGYLCITSVLPILEMYGVPFIGFIDEALVVFMVFHLLARFVIRKNLAPELGRFYLLAFILLMEIGVSFFINRPSPVQTIHFVLTYVRHIPVFICAYLYMRNEKSAHKLLKAYLGFFVLQFILSVTWLMGINPLPNPRSWYDKAMGTLGSCSYVAYYAIGLLTVLLSWVQTVGRKFSVVPYFWSILAFIMVIITITLHAYFLLLAVIFWWIISEIRKKGITVNMVVLSLVIIFISAGLLFLTTVGQEFQDKNIISANYIEMKYRKMMREPKAIVYNNVLNVARRDLKVPIFGGGPGNFASIVAINNETPLATRYVSYMFMSSYSARLLLSGSFTVYPYAGFLSIYGDLGIIGFLLYYGMLLYAMIHIFHNIKRNIYLDKWQLIAAQAVIPVVGMWIALSFIWDVFTLHFLNASVWILIALAWNTVSSSNQYENSTE